MKSVFDKVRGRASPTIFLRLVRNEFHRKLPRLKINILSLSGGSLSIPLENPTRNPEEPLFLILAEFFFAINIRGGKHPIPEWTHPF